MYKSNILHKVFALTVAFLFAAGQATLTQTQETGNELNPELREASSLERNVRQLSEKANAITHSETGKEIASEYEAVVEFVKSEVWPELRLNIVFVATSGKYGRFIGVVFSDLEKNNKIDIQEQLEK